MPNVSGVISLKRDIACLSKKNVDFVQCFWSILAQVRMGSLEQDALMLIWVFCALVRSGAFQLSPF